MTFKIVVTHKFDSENQFEKEVGKRFSTHEEAYKFLAVEFAGPPYSHEVEIVEVEE